MKKKILIIDTNVLLTEPKALSKYPNVLIILPQTVLQELDKIKMSRTDKTLQFNGRLVSRYLFEVSSAGNLSVGVDLENGSTIKVGSIDYTAPIPQSLKTKFSDDQILALAYQVQEKNKESEVVLITNDLNMLIKAQALGLKIEHHGGFNTPSKVKRFFSNQIATIKKNPITALFLVLILGGIIAIIMGIAKIASPVQAPPELIAQQQMYTAKESQYVELLDKNSGDIKALFGLANLYVQMAQYYQDSQYYNKAINRLEQSPLYSDDNMRVKALIARIRFFLGLNDIAESDISEIAKNKSASAFSALVEQGNNATAQKDYNVSVIFLTKALTIKPNDIGTRMDLAQTYLYSNKINLTIDQLHRALKIDNKNGIIYYNLGLIYWQNKNDAATAIGYFEKYLELDPKGHYSKEAKINIDNIKKGTKGN